MEQYNTIAESNNYIVLDKYKLYSDCHETPAAYQSEAALERVLDNVREAEQRLNRPEK